MIRTGRHGIGLVRTEEEQWIMDCCETWKKTEEEFKNNSVEWQNFQKAMSLWSTLPDNISEHENKMYEKYRVKSEKNKKEKLKNLHDYFGDEKKYQQFLDAIDYVNTSATLSEAVLVLNNLAQKEKENKFIFSWAKSKLESRKYRNEDGE